MDIPQLQLTDRERAQITHARHYTNVFADAGIPGHGQFVLIAKLADHIDRQEQAMIKLMQEVVSLRKGER